MSNLAYPCTVLSMPQPEKLSYTVSEAAAATGLSEKTIRRAIDSGDLPSYRPTYRPTILVADLMTWLTTDRATA